MKDELSRRSMLGATGSALAATLAGCASDQNSSETPSESERALSAEEMDWMDRPGDLTYAEFAENSAQLAARSYNRDMEMTGSHIDDAPERDSVDNPIVNLDSVELSFTEVESDTPAERYQAELTMHTNSESVYSDFEDFEGNQELFNDRVAQLFGTVMMPTVGTLFTDSHGPDYRASQTDPDSKAVEGINYVLEDNAGNEESFGFDSSGVDELSQTYDEVTDQQGAFYEKALEELE